MSASQQTSHTHRSRTQHRRGNSAADNSNPASSSVLVPVAPDIPSLVPAPLRPQRYLGHRPSPLAREFVPGTPVATISQVSPPSAETPQEVISLPETPELPDIERTDAPNTTSNALEMTSQGNANSWENVASAPPNRRVRLPPSQVVCRFFRSGYCARGEKCWYKHDIEKVKTSQRAAVASTATTSTTTANAPSSSDSPEVETCSICFDKPETYGLMTGCDHIFCLDCIRKWRCSSSTTRNGRHDDPYADDPLAHTSKTCPLCRVRTQYIIPSVVAPTSAPQKKQIERVYRLRLSKIPCRYFVASLQPRAPPPADANGRVPRHGRLNNSPWCPFGNDCHYQHEQEPGVPYQFSPSQLSRAMWGRRAAARLRAVRWGREAEEDTYVPEWVIRYVDSHHYGGASDTELDDDDWDDDDHVVEMVAGLLDGGLGASWNDSLDAMDGFLASVFS